MYYKTSLHSTPLSATRKFPNRSAISYTEQSCIPLKLDAEDRGAEQFSTGKDGNSIIGSEIGYADDLVSVHELATEIQRKADMVPRPGM